MSDVDDEHVHFCPHELRCTLEVIPRRADRCTHHKAALPVTCREGAPALANQILRRDEPPQGPALVHQRQLLDLPLVHHAFGFAERDGSLVHDEALAGSHPLRDRRRISPGEAEVSFRQEPQQAAPIVHDDERSHA